MPKGRAISAFSIVILWGLNCSGAVAGAIDLLHVTSAKRICEEQGKLLTKGQVSAEGYLYTYDRNHGSLMFSSITKQLLENRFAFFEVERQKFMGSYFGRRAAGSGERYLRFSLAPIDSPACADFIEEVRSYTAQRLPPIRALGLPVNLCIASERVDEPASRYEVNLFSNYSANLQKAQGGGFDWIIHYTLRDRTNDEIVAKVSTNGYDPGRSGGQGFSCPNKDQIELFEKSLRAIGDSRLPEPIRWVDVELEPFPLTYELTAQLLSERRLERRITEEEFLDQLNPVADDGNILLRHKYGFDYVLQIINPGVGIRANVQRAFGKNWSAFQYLRYENGEIRFFGEPYGGALHGNEVAVFRYDRNAKRIAAYRILLPDISFVGDVRYLVDNITFADDEIELTLLDITRGRNGVGMIVLSEYELHVPINSGNIPGQASQHFKLKQAEQNKRKPQIQEILDTKKQYSQTILGKKNAGKTFRDCPDCPEMVAIPKGSFEMGGLMPGEGHPIHVVTIGKDFAMGRTEVTQGQWRAIMGSNPSYFRNCGDDCPVEQVNWKDVKEYIQKLSAKTGKQYRLPSEAEWEFACQAGEGFSYCGSESMGKVAWSMNNSHGITHPVSQKQANAWGLYDMSGNVWEWVEDTYHEDHKTAPEDGSAWRGVGETRVIRGGSWYPLLTPRSAGREHYIAIGRANDIGFRVVRTFP